MFSRNETVYVIDDDVQALSSVCALVQSMGFTAKAFRSAEEFLQAEIDPCAGCIVTDVRMVGMSGLDLQATLREREISLPVIVITAYARTQVTVRAMKQGAVTLLEKPYDENDLWDAIDEALKISRSRQAQHQHRRELQRRFDMLTEKEKTTMRLIVAGHTNKAVAHMQTLSVRTVETRRQKIFRKLGITSVAELVPLVIEYQRAGLAVSTPPWGIRQEVPQAPLSNPPPSHHDPHPEDGTIA